jgi:toxin ParE1/3/4
MRYEVFLTDGAEGDLETIHDYIARFDTLANAAYVLDRLLETVEALVTFPERRSYPPELLALGIRDYRQTFFKPYRLVYRIVKQNVYVYLIADGRRDMHPLLAQRLLAR